MAWPKNRTEFGPNRTPVLFGLSDANETDIIPIAVDPTTGAVLTTPSGGSGGGTSSTFGAAFPTVGTAVGATDGTNMRPLNVDGSGNLKVNLTTALPAGSNAIGSITNTSFGATQATAANLNATVVGTGTFAVQATQSGTWNINNISGTISLPTGAATSANQTNASQKTQIVDGSGNVIASTSNALNVDVTNSTLAVTQSGAWAVTANAGTNLNTSALATSANLTAGTQKTQIVDGSGNVIASTSNALNVDITNTDVPANLAQVAGTTTSVNTGTVDAGTQRVVLPNDAGKTLLSAAGSVSSSGNNTLVNAGANRLKVYAFSLSTTSTTAVTCIFQSGASGTALWEVTLQAPSSVSTGANLVVSPPAWLFATASATLLNLNLSSAQTVYWSVSYWNEA